MGFQCHRDCGPRYCASCCRVKSPNLRPPPTMAAPRSRSRRILRSPSLTSLASSLSSLSLSLYTTTSSRTLWGPGALAGKAILALGKATVRGAERVVIHRRLAVIHANLPCRDDDAAFDSDVHAAFFVGLFDDLLELSRPGLYGDGIRHSAMEIILIQIASSQTTHLINCLSQWMLDDLMLLILEIMSVALFSHSGFLEPRLVDAYTSATAGTTGTTIGRVLGGVPGRAITFISALARQNQIACEAALLCGFLEMLLLTASQLGDMNQEDEDRDALNSAFTALHQSAKRIEHSDSDLADLWHSRLEAFWPAEVHPPSTAFEVAANVTKTAPHTWLAIEAEFLQREAACLVRQSSPPRCPMHAGRTLSDASPFPRMSNMTLSNSAVPEMRWTFWKQDSPHHAPCGISWRASCWAATSVRQCWNISERRHIERRCPC
ncbi:hypothetical protein C8F01DRAFT_561824 [Mycena amicta]|nr:hypothetical protein C8F01DRAFT_561824 [Mycena amicta]